MSQRLRLVDWRMLGTDRMQPLLAEEVDRWARLLEWDTAAEWQVIELARQTGRAPGLAVLDANGAVVGWSHFQTRNHVLHIGSFTAQNEAVAQALIDEIMNERTMAFVQAVSFFAFSDAPGLASVLRGKGLSVDRYWYLGREVQRNPPPILSDVRQWHVGDLPATASLLARSYPARAESRPFAPGGSNDEWNDYVFRLTRGNGCGALDANASLCVPGGPGRLMALALVTRISETTAHLAQLAVDPSMRGRKLGVQLMEMAAAAAARDGCRRMTLMVGTGNHRARSFYEAARFRVMGSFLSAGTLSPRRPNPASAPTPAAMRRPF